MCQHHDSTTPDDGTDAAFASIVADWSGEGSTLTRTKARTGKSSKKRAGKAARKREAARREATAAVILAVLTALGTLLAIVLISS